MPTEHINQHFNGLINEHFKGQISRHGPPAPPR
jgi:hypothetical protein